MYANHLFTKTQNLRAPYPNPNPTLHHVSSVHPQLIHPSIQPSIPRYLPGPFPPHPEFHKSNKKGQIKSKDKSKWFRNKKIIIDGYPATPKPSRPLHVYGSLSLSLSLKVNKSSTPIKYLSRLPVCYKTRDNEVKVGTSTISLFHFFTSPGHKRIPHGKRVKSPDENSGLDSFLAASIRSLVRLFPLTISRVVATEAGSRRSDGGLEVQRAGQHVGFTAKTPLGVEAGRGG